MTDFEDLVVFLVDVDTGLPLLSYDTAKTIPKNSNRQRRCAVEAKADQRFAIEVRVKPAFDWADSNGLDVKIGFDVGEEVNCRSVYILKDELIRDQVDLPYFDYHEGVAFFRIDHLLIDNPEDHDGTALHAHFYFRHLRDDSELKAKNGLPRTIDNQGKIRVEISRTTVMERDVCRGIQASLTPNFRRQTKSYLHRKNITLEVLLNVDEKAGKVTYLGNFRSERCKDRDQQTNFDFIYREAGGHPDFVPKGNIIEVDSFKRSPSNTRTSLPNQGLLVSRQIREDTASPAPNALFPRHPTADPENAFLHQNTLVDSGSAKAFPRKFSSPSVQPKVSPTSSPSLSPKQEFSSPKKESLSPKRESSRATSIDSSSSSTDSMADPARLAELIREYDQRREAEITELRNIENSINEIRRRQDDNVIRRENVRLDLMRTDAESMTLDRTRRELEERRRQLEIRSANARLRGREAIKALRDTLNEIDGPSTEDAIAKKRKRDEDEDGNEKEEEDTKN